MSRHTHYPTPTRATTMWMWPWAAAIALALLVCDQFGVLHAPNARARSWFYERGFGECAVYAHESPSGGLVRISCERLSPAVPRIDLGGDGHDGAVAAIPKVGPGSERRGQQQQQSEQHEHSSSCDGCGHVEQ